MKPESRRTQMQFSMHVIVMLITQQLHPHWIQHQGTLVSTNKQTLFPRDCGQVKAQLKLELGMVYLDCSPSLEAGGWRDWLKVSIFESSLLCRTENLLVLTSIMMHEFLKSTRTAMHVFVQPYRWRDSADNILFHVCWNYSKSQEITRIHLFYRNTNGIPSYRNPQKGLWGRVQNKWKIKPCVDFKSIWS